MDLVSPSLLSVYQSTQLRVGLLEYNLGMQTLFYSIVMFTAALLPAAVTLGLIRYAVRDSEDLDS